MSGNGRGGNNRKNRQRFSGKRDEPQKNDKKKQNNSLLAEGKLERNRISLHERPRWIAPKLPADPITTPDCPWCGKQIKDITTAISDKSTGLPVHFDCVLERITKMETLELNDSICYIGGGRFGVVHINNPPDTRNFSIKKILEWEIKENNNDWRRPISEYFSIT
ncbi:MAG: hypothetical protein LBH44_14390 [Treponema sp.]|jgi:hypothetical protein|nr:hypothetical protein [Treponema sp.]